MKKAVSLMMSLLMIFSFMTPYASAETENGGYAAIVDAVTDSNGLIKVYFPDCEYELGISSYTFYVQDPDFDYEFIKNGEAADVYDIKEGDVLNFYYDINEDVRDVYELKVDISDKTVSGQVEQIEEEDDTITCVVDGETYVTAMGVYPDVGEWYEFRLDSRERIVSAEIDYTKKTYAVIDRVYLDLSEKVYKARMILFDGTRKEFGFSNSDVAEDMINFAYTDAEYTELVDLDDRFIEYQLDENGNISSFEREWLRMADDEYNAERKSVANVALSENTKILDLTYVYGHEGYYDSDIAVFPLSKFKDGDMYTILGSKTDNEGKAIFAAVIRTETDIQTDSPFAVVEKTDIESIPNKIYLTTGDEVSKEYKVDSEISIEEFEKGDLVTFAMDSKGRISDIALVNKTSEILKNREEDYIDFYNLSQNTGILDDYYYLYYQSGVYPWDESSYFDGIARYSFGAVRNIGDGMLSISDVSYDNGYYDDYGYEEYFDGYHVYYTYDYELSDNLNIIVYDKADKKIKQGSLSDILPMYGGREGGAWIEYDNLAGYAFIKTFNDVVTDIYYIKPEILPADYDKEFEDYDAFDLRFSDINGLTLQISDIFPTFKNKTLYVCTYDKEGRLTDIQDSTVAKAALTFKNAKPGDVVKAFIMGDNLEPMSITAEDIIGDDLGVNILPDGEADRTLKFSSNEIVSFSREQLVLDNSAYTPKSIAENVRTYINGFLIDERPEYIFEEYSDIQCKISDSDGDRKYEIFRMEVSSFAVVEDVVKADDHIKLIFNNFSPELKSSVDIYKDNYHEYKIVKDGEEILPSEIKAGDILNLYFDITKPFEDSKAVLIKVSDKTVTGMVTSRYRDANDRGVYVIDGQEYTFAFDGGWYELEVGETYVLYVDADNKIIYFDEASKNYGIIDRVWKDPNDDYKVRFITADGTRESYIIKKGSVDVARDIAYDYNYDLRSVQDRVVSYKINSNNEVYNLEQIVIMETSAEYNADSCKIGLTKMDEGTVIFDLSADVDWNDTACYSTSDLKAGSLSTFKDGEEYVILSGDKASSGISQVVVIMQAPYGVSVTAPFAVVDSVSEGMVDGSERYCFNLYTADSDGEIVSYYLDEDEDVDAGWFSRGDVIAYSLTCKGEMGMVRLIFSVADNAWRDNGIDYEDALRIFEDSYMYDPMRMYDNWFLESGVPSWDYSDLTTSKGFVRVGFAAVVGKSPSSLTLAQFKEADEEIKGYDDFGDEDIIARNGDIVSYGDDIQEMDVSSDVNVYVYDFNEKDRANSGRLRCGAYGDILKTSIPQSMISEDLDGMDVYNWTQIYDLIEIYPNYVFFKMLNNEITDILVIIPKD